jgi:hypothetical protein
MDESGEAEGSLPVPEPVSAPPVADFEDTSGKIDEDEYEEITRH